MSVSDEDTLRFPKATYGEMEHLITSLPTVLIGLSRDRKIVFWNTMAEKVFDRPRADVWGLSPACCGLNCDWVRISDGIAKSLIDQQPVRVDDIEIRRPDGEKGYLAVTIQPLNGKPDSLWEIAILGAEITERKKLEAQLQQSQKMEAIGQLAAGIAHEINTPTQFVGDNTHFFQDAFDDLLRIVNIYKELVAAAASGTLTAERIRDAENQVAELDLEYLESEIPVAIEHSLKGVGSIAKIVQAMKIFAHPGGAEKEPTDIHKEIEKTVTITRNEWKYVAEMITDFDESLVCVPCFQAELNQVILNLIVNAAHAIAAANKDDPNKMGRIRISTRREGDWAKIRISDTGTGIPRSIRHRVFDLFFTTKEPGKGTGQGLAISHSVIVEKHKGKLTLETREGKGTTFTISLPLSADQQNDE